MVGPVEVGEGEMERGKEEVRKIAGWVEAGECEME